MGKEISSTKQKILLCLIGGLSMGLSYSPERQVRIFRKLIKELKKVDNKKLKQEVQYLYSSKMVGLKENPDGTTEIQLTDKGRLKVLKYHFEKMQIDKKGKWDAKWRMVVFDIPEKLRKGRDALRYKLKTLGLYELQKSVFVFPYACKDEIDFLVECFNLRKYVRYGVLEHIDNDLHLRKIFKL